MKRFGIGFLKFILMGGAPIVLLLIAFDHYNIQPLLTNSISYDLKMESLFEKNMDTIDIISLGSSVTLNNVHSGTIIDNLDSDITYYNVSSWNAKMRHNLELIRALVPLYHPKMILMVNCHVDFEKPMHEILSSSDIKTYLTYGLKPYFILKEFDLLSLLKRRNDTDQMRHPDRLKTHKHFILDEYGGISLTIEKENYDHDRWDRPLMTDIVPRQYEYLSDISNYLREAGVPLVFVNTVMKQSNCQTDSCRQFQREHLEKVKEIVEYNQHIFLDMHKLHRLPDSLFCDEIHLNKQGPEVFTKLLVDELSNLGVYGFGKKTIAEQ